ncbi:MAG: STAS/SEC14 domain-containing protein [Bacteroidetes bacterium]|nr:STAS/SEC14 domain-containing protein [Bacteroidota bacterium]
MKAPENTKVYESSTSTHWYDENEILCSISKKTPPLSLEEMKKTIQDFLSTLRTEKVCMLIDVTHASESSREVRDYAAEELPKFVKAIAILSDSALGKMLANLFFRLTTHPYPTKMFNDEQEAKEWLKQYL